MLAPSASCCNNLFMPESFPDTIPETVDAMQHEASAIADVDVTDEAVVMCHRYPDLECLDPADCPNVYAKCWQYRIWNR